MSQEAFPASMIYERLETPEIETLNGWLDRLQIPAGSVLSTEGGSASDLYLLDQGSIEVMLNGRVLGIVEAPSAFGIGSLLTERMLPFQYRVRADASLRRLRKSEFQRQISASNNVALRLAYNLARVTCFRMADLLERLPEIVAAPDLPRSAEVNEATDRRLRLIQKQLLGL